MATTATLYTSMQAQAQAPSAARRRAGSDALMLSKARVRTLENEQLLDICEDLYEACVAEDDPTEATWLRQRLDLANAEARRRKLINWEL